MQRAYEEKYHRVEASHWWFVARRQIVRALLAKERPNPKGRILEMGCSGGLLMRELESDGWQQVTGIDISPDAIELCRRVGLDARVMDAQELALADATFDVVTASDVLEHLADEQKAIREWKRVLKPSGLLVVFAPAFMLLWSGHDAANKHYRRYRRKQLIRLLESNGLVVERSSYWNVALFGPIAAIRLLRKLWRRRTDTEGSGDLFEPPKTANALLTKLLQIENWLLGSGVNSPFGVSVFVLARKPLTPKDRLP